MGSITTGGAGGAGTANSISGSSITYAGGGGGAGYTVNGAGGTGGGGAGKELTAMQKFEASKSVGGINQSIMFSQQDDKSKQFFEDYSKKDLIMPEETKETEGLD